MRAHLLALLAALLAGPVSAQEPPPRTVSPVTVSPAAKPPRADVKIDMAGDDALTNDFVAIWPATAYQTRRSGRVTLSCMVDVHGLAEWCKVASETPAGQGFGKAALQLRPTFLLKPATGADGQPVNRVMNLAITFKPPRDSSADTIGGKNGISSMGDVEGVVDSMRSAGSNALAMRDVTMVDNPLWIQAASFDDLARAYPSSGGGRPGYAAAHCRVERSGGKAGLLQDCQVIQEQPKDAGFAAAALSLTPKFRIAPASLAEAPRRAPLWVDVPIRFAPPGPAPAGSRVVAAPLWLAAFDARAALKVFPPEAADQGLTTGRGVVRCRVAAGGAVADCTPEPAEPQGLGFSEAVAKLATTMKMNLWAADATPVEGGVVYVAMRLNLRRAE